MSPDQMEEFRQQMLAKKLTPESETPVRISALLAVLADRIEAQKHSYHLAHSGLATHVFETIANEIRAVAKEARSTANTGTQRPGSPDGSLATETRKPGSLK